MRPRPTRGPHTFDAFRNRVFRLMWPANFCSYVTRWMQLTLLSLLVLNLTGSPFRVALVGFFAMAPLLAFGVFGGLMADRLGRRHLLLGTQTATLAASLTMLTLLITDKVELWHAYGTALTTGMAWAFDMPARRSIAHDLFPRGGVTNAMALDSVGMHGSRMIGPALAGGMITIAGFSAGYAVACAFYAVAIFFVWIADIPKRRHTPSESSSIARNLLEGFVYVKSNRLIFATVVVTILMNLLLFPYVQMIPVIARETLGVSEGLTGLLMGADGLGAIVGAIAIASAGSVRHHGRIFVGGSFVGLVMAFVFANSGTYSISLPVLIGLGFGASGFGTMQGTIVVLAASDGMRGRALGVVSLAIGAGPIGALIIGAIAEATSPATAIKLLSGTGVAAIILAGLLMSALRSPTEAHVTSGSADAAESNARPAA